MVVARRILPVGAATRCLRSDPARAVHRSAPHYAKNALSSSCSSSPSHSGTRPESHTLAVHRSLPSIRTARRSIDPSATVGFVPTMGALHEGHAALVREARLHNDVVVASVFVNPTQFGPNEDLDKYPRRLERDAELLQQLGVDHLFAPDADAMYGKNHITYVVPEGFDEWTEEGRARPGHFRGVATVVTKLLNLVQPARAYFGRKDAAQCVLIRRVIDDLNLGVECVAVNTVREHDGLALSSRNAYLGPEERAAAPVVYRALTAARDLWERRFGGEPVPADSLREAALSVLRSEPLVRDVQYVAVDDPDTMRPLNSVPTRGGSGAGEAAIVSVACLVGSVRLIDNVVLQ